MKQVISKGIIYNYFILLFIKKLFSRESKFIIYK